LLHASGSVDEAKDEIAIYFNQNEIVDYKMIIETVLYEEGWGLCKKEG